MNSGVARRAAVLGLGLAADAVLPDPPTRLHPVGWLGSAVVQLRTRAPGDPASRRRYGLAAALSLPAAAALGALVAQSAARGMTTVPGIAAEAAMLSLATSQRALLRRAASVQAALDAGDLDAARWLLGYHLVSRDTAALSPSEVAAATIESVAENLSDGVVAPWCWYAVAGLPGAAAYRAANTLDAMWGYRTPEFADLGWGAARLDDLLNLGPARLTAGAIAVAAGPARARAVATWRRDAGATASPNAGHPMAAMAGALGVRLEKRDAYVLGVEFPAPAAADITRAVGLARRAAFTVAGALSGALLTGALVTGRTPQAALPSDGTRGQP